MFRTVARLQPGPQRVMNTSLLGAIRTIIRADSGPLRRELFARLEQQRLGVRIVLRIHRLLADSLLSTLLVSGYGLTALTGLALPRYAGRLILGIAVHANARRKVGHFMSWVDRPSGVCLPSRGSLVALLSAIGAGFAFFFELRGLRRNLRFMSRINSRNSFLVSCRVAATLVSYVRARQVFLAGRVEALVVSSTSNPEEVAFAAAARALNVPSVFISHSYPTPESIPLDFSLSVLEGSAAVDAHRQNGPIRGGICLGSLSGPSAAMEPGRLLVREPVVGLFPPKIVDSVKLEEIVAECLDLLEARQVVIRWHPSTIDRPEPEAVRRFPDRVSESTDRESVGEVAAKCDWVIAGLDSNVHLDILRLGIPSIAVSGIRSIDGLRPDLYDFAKNGVVFPALDNLAALSIPEAVSFYSGDWHVRFRSYDASYMTPPSETVERVRSSYERLLEDARR